MDSESPKDSAPGSDDAWFEENFLDLVQQHPGSWIAVLDRKIVAEGATKFSVEAAAKKAAGGRVFSLYYIEPTALLY